MQAISIPGSILAAAAVLLLPGGALLAWIMRCALRSERRSLAALLVDACGLSIALYSLLGMLMFFTGVRVSATALWVFYGLCLLALLAAARRTKPPGDTPSGEAAPAGAALRRLVEGVFTAALVGLLVGWRLYQARALVLPAWVDPVHHTLIVRLILEQGGLPGSFLPYFEAPFIYHFGFHLTTALFAFWSGAPPEQAVLWFGQLLNGLVALSVLRVAEMIRPAHGMNAAGSYAYAAGMYAAGNHAAGAPAEMDRWVLWRGRFSAALPLVAALLVGFAFQMPAYYLTWGRFTLLTGLLLTGPALAAALEAWRDPQRFDAWLRLTLLVAGLALTHYFALLVVAVFLGVLGMAALVQIPEHRDRWDFLWRMAAFALVGLALAAPWLWHVQQFSQVGPDVVVASPFDTAEAARQQAADSLRYLRHLLGPRRSHILLALAAVGALAALRHPTRRAVAWWGLLLALLALPWGLRFAPFRPDHFAIVLFFPAALLLAGLLVDGAAALAAAARPWLGGLVLAGLCAALVVWGMRETRDILNPATIFTVEADRRALDWVRANTPAEARFYINSTPWQGAVYRGLDGGYWLAPYAGRVSLPPPAFYVWGTPEYAGQINDWAARANALTGCTPEFGALMREARVSHLYLRAGQGSLQPAGLDGCSILRPLYQDGGVYIYAVLPE